jgi:hypothetical protein
MTARYLTASELGRLVGVSRQAVADAKRKGLISPNREGLFDIMSVDLEQWIKKRPYQRVQAARKTAREASSPFPAEIVGSAKPSEEMEDTELDEMEELTPNARHRSARGSSKGDPSYAESERKLKAAQADFWSTRAAEKRGEYIPKPIVEAFFNKLYAIEQSQFLVRGDRMAANLVAIVRSATDNEAELAVNRALTEDAYKEQSYKKAELEKFLHSIKAELNEEATS